jgi:hypothetical protein
VSVLLSRHRDDAADATTPAIDLVPCREEKSDVACS